MASRMIVKSEIPRKDLINLILILGVEACEHHDCEPEDLTVDNLADYIKNNFKEDDNIQYLESV